MIEANWASCHGEFVPDGGLRDIYILDTDISDWERLLTFLRRSYSYEFTTNGDTSALPVSAAEIFQQRDQASPLLTVDVCGISVNCHFFWDGDIELDIDPREVTDEFRFQKLLEFLRSLSTHLSRPVILTPENGQEHKILELSPESNCVKYFPA